MKILIVAFVGDVLLCMYFINLLFLSNTPLVEAAPVMAMTTSPDLDQLIQGFQKVGMSPTLSQEVTRKYISAPGEIIALGVDNIEVFQYEDTVTAVKEATSLSARYANNTRSTLWKKDIHLYATNNMTIFYLGENQSILSILNQSLGLHTI
jgi:hypothetical protein